MPGFEVRLLSSAMMQAVLNKGVNEISAFELGKHIVQYDVPIKMLRGELVRLHFGVFGYTGAGKSNLVSTLIDNLLSSNHQPLTQGEKAFKVVLIDLMDEYTGLLIDHLSRHNYSRLVVCGRHALPDRVIQACVASAQGEKTATQLAHQAAEDWSERLILPSELKSESRKFVGSLADLITQRKILFYEPTQQQGLDFDLDAEDLLNEIGPKAYGTNQTDRDNRVKSLIERITPLIKNAQAVEGKDRDVQLTKVIDHLRAELQKVKTSQAQKGIREFIGRVENQMHTRGKLPDSIATDPWKIANLLNFQPRNERHHFYPSLTVVIGESDESIANFIRQLVDRCFEQRRVESILYPSISFIFDEADVFIGQVRGQTQTGASLIEQATTLARRGRKFGLGIGIATQRVRFLDTSIMAQPHTYFISKLPRKSDREAVAEAFALSDETLEQTFGFTVGQWLVTSHDATGLKGVPFPVQVPNANTRVLRWLESHNSKSHDYRQ